MERTFLEGLLEAALSVQNAYPFVELCELLYVRAAVVENGSKKGFLGNWIDKISFMFIEGSPFCVNVCSL